MAVCMFCNEDRTPYRFQDIATVQSFCRDCGEEMLWDASKEKANLCEQLLVDFAEKNVEVAEKRMAVSDLLGQSQDWRQKGMNQDQLSAWNSYTAAKDQLYEIHQQRLAARCDLSHLRM